MEVVIFFFARPIKNFRWLILFFVFTLPGTSKAVPLNSKKLSSLEQQLVAEKGYKYLSTKGLSDPYPLGGNPGLEFGYSREFYKSELIDGLTTSNSRSLISIGKGLFYHIDVYLNFMPGENSQYGGLVRWSCYQMKTLPILFSFQAHGGSGALTENVFIQTYGGDLLATYYQPQFGVFAGIGLLRSTTRFTGGSFGATINQETSQFSVQAQHKLLGAVTHFTPFFAVIQADEYAGDVSIGVRFGIRNF